MPYGISCMRCRHGPNFKLTLLQAVKLIRHTHINIVLWQSQLCLLAVDCTVHALPKTEELLQT